MFGHAPQPMIRGLIAAQSRPQSAFIGLKSDRRIDEDLVLLSARLALVLLVDELERAFAQERTRQNHRTNEAAWPVHGSLREHRIGSALVPCGARTVACRVTQRIDADAAFDQTTDARALVPMQKVRPPGPD